MIRGTAIAASDPSAALGGEAALDEGWSAVDAIIAGFLAAAGAEPGVLFAPAVALVAGTAVGARAFDGRSAQPGKGAARPRGYVDDATIPDAARFPVPRALAMLALLHSYGGRGKLRDLARHGVLAAEKRGASRRVAVLRAIGDGGVLALRGRDVERALLERGGPVAGGTITPDDLADLRTIDERAVITQLSDQVTVLGVPWETRAGPEGEAQDRGAGAGRNSEVLVACDGRGIVAALAYTPARAGIAIDELELLIAPDAVPVRRGVTRVPPGTPLAAPAPIAILARSGGFWAAVGLPGQTSIAPDLLHELAGGLSVEMALEALLDRERRHAALAAVRDGRDARAVVVGVK